jgi:hypothetical protein
MDDASSGTNYGPPISSEIDSAALRTVGTQNCLSDKSSSAPLAARKIGDRCASTAAVKNSYRSLDTVIDLINERAILVPEADDFFPSIKRKRKKAPRQQTTRRNRICSFRAVSRPFSIDHGAGERVCWDRDLRVEFFDPLGGGGIGHAVRQFGSNRAGRDHGADIVRLDLPAAALQKAPARRISSPHKRRSRSRPCALPRMTR